MGAQYESYAVVNMAQSPLRFTLLHQSESAARAEAERLARANPDTLFAVIAIVATCKAKAPLTWEEKCRSRPF